MSQNRPLGGASASARWLVFSYWANVDAMACSIHIDDRLPYLDRLGLAPEVIAGVCGPRPPGWGRRWHRVPSFSASGYRFEMRYQTRRLPRPWRSVAKLLLTLPIVPLYACEQLLARLDSTFWWWLSAAGAGLWWSRRRPALLYSTGGAMSAHLAAALVARVRRLPWIAEIQDPLVYQGIGRGPLPRWLLRTLERLIHTRATGVVYLTQTASTRAVARTGGTAPCRAIYAGGAPLAAPAAGPRRGPMRLLHAGTLAGSRHPGVLLQALEELARRRPEVRAEVRLVLLGSLDTACLQMARAFPFPEMVEAPGKLPRDRARELVAEADLLLVLQNLDRVSEETIPSKTYEYLVSGRPVLGLVYRNEELTSLLQAAGHRAAEADDASAVRAALEDLYQEWREARLAVAPQSELTVARAVAELVAWSQESCRKGRGEQTEGVDTWAQTEDSPAPRARS